MTGSRAGGLVYLDGYAGRGRYENESQASAELILRIAENQAKYGIKYQLFFYEPDATSYPILKGVVDEYVARGVRAQVTQSEVIQRLDDVVGAARGLPLFLFLDPCGLGVPFSVLAQMLTGPRASRWPPTEILLNFSLEAVRRIGGHVSSASPSEKTMARLDEALGGSWWRNHVRDGVTDEAVRKIIDGFKARLSEAAGMDVFAIPVRRAPSHKPVYFLVFGTRSPLGLWHLADSTARATDTWWAEAGAREDAKLSAEGQDPLFEVDQFRTAPKLAEVEAEAVPVIVENLADLLACHGRFVVGDYPAEVFGEFLGRVREVVVRAAIKRLHADGRTLSDGMRGRPAALVVTPPR